MRKIPGVIYLTADELDEIIDDRAAEAASLPPGLGRQTILKEVAQLRVYAAAKRWIQPVAPERKPSASARPHRGT